MVPAAGSPPGPQPRWPDLAALLVAGLVLAVTVRAGTFVGTHADASGYVAEGHLWATGRLYRPEAAQLWATWPLASATGSPLGFRPAPGVSGTSVPVYPLGLPLMLAAAERIGGRLAVFVVVPLMAAILVLAAFRLASALAGPLAGLLAAVFVALDPLVLLHTVHPMSDVPAAALYLVAWWLSLRGASTSAFAAGWCMALAVMVRPNFAVLTLAPATTLLVSGWFARDRRGWWWPFVAFLSSAAVGPALVAWSQAALYGSPLASSYPGAEAFFRLRHAPDNARNYWRSFVDVYRGIPIMGLGALAALVPRVGRPLTAGQRHLVAGAIGIVGLNLATYAFYLPYADWTFLRLFLPALVTLMVLLAATIAWSVRWLWMRPARRALVVLPLVAAVVVAGHRQDLRAYALNDWRAQRRVVLMGRYLEAALPPHTTVLSFLHSGSLVDDTGCEVVRLDVLPPDEVDAVVDALLRRGVPVAFVLDGIIEEPRFKEVFARSRFGRLDWPPRAEFVTTGTIRYYLAADRERFLAGDRWPVDVVR